MIYKQHQPHPALAAYIDAFWTTTANKGNTEEVKILPDGCVDLIINLGEDCKTDNGISTINHGKTYLVGTMSKYKTVTIHPETALLGIRFKPAAFSAFYQFTSLHQVTNLTVDFEAKLSPDPRKLIADPTRYLTKFFHDKFTPLKHPLLPVITDIEMHKGQISVSELAKRHFIIPRQLERAFRQHVGLSPKEFINFVRYQFVRRAIRNRPVERSLADIAFAHGYYDHAHLSHEIKRYTGVAPSQL
jgi:AraC-like DNA-binding protein